MTGTLNLNQIDSTPTGFNVSGPASAPAAPAPISLSNLDAQPPAGATQTATGASSINLSTLDAQPTNNINSGAAPPSPPASGLLRDIAGGAAKDVQDAADFGKMLYQRITNPTYAPKISGYKPGPRGPIPIITAPDVPAAQVPGVSDFANNTNAQGVLGNAALGIGEMVPYALTGAGEIGGIADAAKAVGSLAAMGAGSGAGQQIGQDIAPDGYKGVGAFVGSLLGGVGVAGLGAGVGKAADAISDIAPTGRAMQGRQALLTLQNMVPDLAGVRQTVADRLSGTPIPTAEGPIPLGPNGEIIPGSRPSVAQLSGNVPAAQLEEALKAIGAGSALDEANQASANARSAVLRNSAPEGTPSSMGEYLQEARADQDRVYAQRADAETKNAQKAVETQPGLAGEVEPFQAGMEFQNALNAPDVQRKTAVTALYNQFRERNPVMDLSPLQDTVEGIQKDIAAEGAGDVDAKEQSFLSRASNLASDPNATWRKMDALRKEVGAYIENASGKFGQPTYNSARMTALKSGIDNAEQTAADRLPAQDPEWGGILNNANTAYSGLDPIKVKASLEAMAEKGKNDERLPVANIHEESGLSAPLDGGIQNSGGAGEDVGSNGGRGAPDGPDSFAQRNPGVAPDSHNAVSRWTNADSQKLTEARSAHGERMDLYRNDQIGPLLAKAPGGKFDLAGDELLPRVVPSGPAGAAMARAIRKAAPDSPHILPSYQTAIGLDMRRAAMRNGQIDRGALARWARNKAPLLAEMPDIAARVSHIDQAQQFAEEALENRVRSAKTYNEGAIGQILNGHDPAVVMRGLLSGKPSDATLFRKIISRNPEALAGAQKAGWDYLASQFLSPRNGGETGEEALNITGLKALLRDPTKLQNLRTLLGDQAPQILRRVVQEFDFYNTGSLSKLSQNGSRTVPLSEAVKRLQEPKTLLGRIFKSFTNPTMDALGAHAAGAGPIGMAGAYVGSNMVKGYLERSRASANELLSRSMADPRLFLQLTKNIPIGASAASKFWRHFMSVFANSIMQTQGSQ